MGSKPLRTKRKSASIESCLRPLGATIDMATPDMWTSNRLWEGGIVALIFTKRQLKGRGGYWVVSPSGNCCELFKHQDLETDRVKRQALLHQIQQLMHERVMFAPIWLYIWPSGIGPRVEEPALMLINPFPWAAPLEEVRLKQR